VTVFILSLIVTPVWTQIITNSPFLKKSGKQKKRSHKKAFGAIPKQSSSEIMATWKAHGIELSQTLVGGEKHYYEVL
jgi:hypothetical protein